MMNANIHKQIFFVLLQLVRYIFYRTYLYIAFLDDKLSEEYIMIENVFFYNFSYVMANRYNGLSVEQVCIIFVLQLNYNDDHIQKVGSLSNALTFIVIVALIKTLNDLSLIYILLRKK